MKHHIRATAHIYLTAALVAALLSVIACRTATRAGSAGTGAVLGSVAGPLGIATGAIVGDLGGDALADALGADKEYSAKEYRKLLEDAHKTIAELQAREPIKVPVEVPVDRPFVPSWVWRTLWIGALFLVFRFRQGILAFIATASTGGFKAALLTLAGLVWGGKAADAAKAEVARHEERSPLALALRQFRRPIPRPRPAPGTIIPGSQEVKPHA